MEGNIIIYYDLKSKLLLSVMSMIVQQDGTMYSLLYFCKLLYMLRVVTPPIIRSTYNCNYIANAESRRDGKVHTSHL